jgi:hypothetical protein
MNNRFITVKRVCELKENISSSFFQYGEYKLSLTEVL